MVKAPGPPAPGSQGPTDEDSRLVEQLMEMVRSATEQGGSGKRLDQLLEFANKNLERVAQTRKDKHRRHVYLGGSLLATFLFCFTVLLWYGQGQLAGDMVKIILGAVAGWLARGGSWKSQASDRPQP
jgi:hypothetical protein